MTNGDYCVPGNAVPTVEMTLGTPFPGVPAGNDPCYYLSSTRVYECGKGLFHWIQELINFWLKYM